MQITMLEQELYSSNAEFHPIIAAVNYNWTSLDPALFLAQDRFDCLMNHQAQSLHVQSLPFYVSNACV